MTSSADLIADPATALHACLDLLSNYPIDRLGPTGQADLLQALSRAEARVTALRLRVLAAADRANTAALSGAASTGQWAATVANADQARTHRDVGLAEGLGHRAAARAALTAGSISAEHAAVIVQTDRNLPRHVTMTQRESVEAALVAKAQTLSPSSLRKVARRALAEIEPDEAVVDAHENDLVATEEERARAATRLTLHDNADGTVSGHFTVPATQGQLLRKILATITAPRRGRLGASVAQVGENTGLQTDWDHARGEAFCELIEHLPTDHLHPRTAATLVVRIDESVLRGALKAAHLDTGGALSAGEARRLACNSGILPTVLSGASLPLDLGRSARLFSEAQRTAVGLTRTTCAAQGCERPFAWCELHHRRAWADGGGTDLAEAVPLCHFHHRRIHDRSFTHTRTRDGSISFRSGLAVPGRRS